MGEISIFERQRSKINLLQDERETKDKVEFPGMKEEVKTEKLISVKKNEKKEEGEEKLTKVEKKIVNEDKGDDIGEEYCTQ